MKKPTILAKRNKAGVVTVRNGSGNLVTAKIPNDRSMLGMLSTNGIIPGGEYRKDGWVYLNDTPVRKWHIRLGAGSIRVWEPKLENLSYLYFLLKRVVRIRDDQWNETRKVIRELWGDHKQGDEVIAHAYPVHHLKGAVHKDDHWEYSIHDYGWGYGLSFGFQWTKGNPKTLVNHKLGQQLYELEHRSHDLNSRVCKVRNVFYDAMTRSLPKATENKVMCLQFGEDTYWFFTKSTGPNIHWWEMFDDQYKFEVKKIV